MTNIIFFIIEQVLDGSIQHPTDAVIRSTQYYFVAMTVLAVIVPADESKPLLEQEISEDMDDHLESLTRTLQQETGMIVEDVRQTLLLRSTCSGEAGLMAYHVTTTAVPAGTTMSCLETKNVRATRLAMACGKFACKFYGTVLLVRSSLSARQNLRIDEVLRACCISLDLRPSVQQEMLPQSTTTKSLFDEYSNKIPPPVPIWLGNALKQNYHDQVAIDKLADVMKPRNMDDDDSESSSDDDDDDDDGEEVIPGPRKLPQTTSVRNLPKLTPTIRTPSENDNL